MKKKMLGRIASLFLACLLLAVYATGCAKSEQPLTVEEQLELGMRYLRELDYENAIIAFAAAIEIDPKNVQAYAGLYTAYIARGDAEKADEIWIAMLEAGVSVDEVLSWVEKLADLITEGGGDGETVKQAAQEKARGEGTNGTTPLYAVTQDKEIEITITPTSIMADLAGNYNGLGRLTLNGEMGEAGNETLSQTAMINSSGEFLVPYLATKSRFYYNDGVICLWDGYLNGGVDLSECDPMETQYYNADGSVMLSADFLTNPDDLKRHLVERHPDVDDRIIYLGELIVKLELHPFGDGVAFVRCAARPDQPDGWGYGFEADRCYLIDKQGNILLTFPEEFSESAWVSSFMYTGLGGLAYSSEGLIKVGCLYRLGDHISDTTGANDQFVDGQWVKQEWPVVWESAEDYVYGFMDHSGNIVIPQMYLAAGNFSEGLALVKNVDGLWGYIDKSNNTVIPFEYNSGGSFVDGLAAVSKGGKTGFINIQNEVVIPLEYDRVYSFVDGLAAVSKDGKTGYINVQNEVVIPFEYDDGFGAGGGVCAVAKNGKYGLVDYNNNEVLPFEYDDISTCVDGVVYAVKDGLVYIITVKQ